MDKMDGKKKWPGDDGVYVRLGVSDGVRRERRRTGTEYEMNERSSSSDLDVMRRPETIQVQ